MNSFYYKINDNTIDNNDRYKNDENADIKIVPQFSSIYLITHTILSFFAIYLSWKCSGSKFNWVHFLIALLCPHLYIMWSLAVHGGCGIFEEPSKVFSESPKLFSDSSLIR